MHSLHLRFMFGRDQRLSNRFILSSLVIVGLIAGVISLAAPPRANALAAAAPSTNLVETAAVVASSEQGQDGRPGSAVADGYYRTYWASADGDSTRSLTFRLAGAPSDDAKRAVGSYFVRSAKDNKDAIPSSWVLEGSNDGVRWRALDRRSGVLKSTKQTAAFTIARPQAFNSYRLRFGASKGRHVEIADVALCEGPCDTSINSVGEAMAWPITAHGEFITTNMNGTSTRLADGLAGTAWVAGPGRAAEATATISAPFGHALPMPEYAIVAGRNPEMFPKSWKIEGSNDAINWTVIDEQNGKWFTRAGQKVMFKTGNLDRNYRLYRLTAGERSEYAEIALCSWSCSRMVSNSGSEFINPVSSEFNVTVNGARTNVAALTSEIESGPWTLDAKAKATVEYRSKNGQAQSVGSYTIQAQKGSPLSWTVWGKRTSRDRWSLMDTRTNQVGDGSLQTFGMVSSFPVAELKVEFQGGSRATNIERFSVCDASDCQTELTGAPSDPATTVWFARSANNHGRGSLVGNGPLGAVVYGRVAEERININEHQIWSGNPVARGLTTTQAVRDEFTQAVYKDDPDTVNRIVKESFLDTLPPATYQTAGNLLIDTHDGSSSSQYRRWLDTSTGVATVSYIGDSGARYTRRTFGSFADPVIVSNFSVDGGSQDLTLRYESPMPDVTVSARQRTAISAELIVDGATEGNPGMASELKYRVHIIVRANNGTLNVVGNTIDITGTSSADILIAADTNYTNYRRLSSDPAALTRNALNDNLVNRRSFDDLLQRHLSTYEPLFDRVSFSFPATEADRKPTEERSRARPSDPSYYALDAQYARYLLMASSRNGSEPANLHGRWNDQRYPLWWADYHLDFNQQMGYSFAENLNVPETTESYFDFIDDMAAEGKRLARDQYGVTNGGWVAHMTADVWRQSPVLRGTHTQWVQGGNWMAQALWDHYEYSGDQRFLKNRAYPVLKGNALFFDAILVTNPDPGDNHLVHFWSTSPENTPVKANGTKLSQVQMMPTMDAQLIRATYEHVIEASETLGVDADLRSRWAANLRRLPPPDPIGRWGQIQEYYRDIDREGDAHRHTSHLWGAAEGNSLDLENPVIANAVRTTLRKRGNGTGPLQAWRGMIEARLGDADTTIIDLQRSASTLFPEFSTSGAPFPQMDATFGTADVFTEMLVQSHRDSIDLLWALPKDWKTGHLEGVRARGGFTITDLTWDNGVLTSVSIRSQNGNPLVVRYNGRQAKFNTSRGEVIKLDGNLKRR